MQGVMSTGIDFHGNQIVENNPDLNSILNNFAAVYLAEAGSEDASGAYSGWLGGNLVGFNKY